MREQDQAEPVQLRLAQIKQLTVGRDTFVVLRNFWIPRFRQKGFRYVQDALDTVLVAEALLQRHINRGGLELLRYVGTMAENSPAMGGTSFGSTEYYSFFVSPWLGGGPPHRCRRAGSVQKVFRARGGR